MPLVRTAAWSQWDLDATIVVAHSEKEQAAPTWKKTFGFHPMTAWADHGADGNGEPLAIVLRPGNAGSNTAADHIEAARLALAQLPRQVRRKVLVRADSGGGTHEFLQWLTAKSRRLHYSIGMTITEDMQEAVLNVPASAWTPAYDGNGKVREGAWVADSSRPSSQVFPQAPKMSVQVTGIPSLASTAWTWSLQLVRSRTTLIR